MTPPPSRGPRGRGNRFPQAGAHAEDRARRSAHRGPPASSPRSHQSHFTTPPPPPPPGAFFLLLFIRPGSKASHEGPLSAVCLHRGGGEEGGRTGDGGGGGECVAGYNKFRPLILIGPDVLFCSQGARWGPVLFGPHCAAGQGLLAAGEP